MEMARIDGRMIGDGPPLIEFQMQLVGQGGKYVDCMLTISDPESRKGSGSLAERRCVSVFHRSFLSNHSIVLGYL